jgi:hypothetical protein
MDKKIYYSVQWGCYVTACTGAGCTNVVKLTETFENGPAALSADQVQHLRQAAPAALCDDCKSGAING